MAAIKEFSVEEKLTALVRLQKIDSKLDEIQILKGELPIEVKDLEDEIEGLHARQTRIEEEINGIQEFIEQKKQGIKDAQALIAKYEKQSDNVKNSREFEALNKEIEMQQLEEKLCEKHIKDASLELRDRTYLRTKTEEKINDVQETLQAKRAELEKITVETVKEEAILAEKSAAAKEKVDARVLVAYERIRASYRNGLSVVPVIRDSCGGCFNVIPPQRQSEIRKHNKIIVCEHCGRILVDSEMNEKVAADQK
jgi:predicted  nucleic acid-binding Zn-ribbon protein